MVVRIYIFKGLLVLCCNPLDVLVIPIVVSRKSSGKEIRSAGGGGGGGGCLLCGTVKRRRGGSVFHEQVMSAKAFADFQVLSIV